jgi:hypothetical protein
MRILRVVGSASLPCGCFVGLYETYDGPTVQIVDERGVACPDAGHRLGHRISAPRFDAALVTSGRTPAPSRSVESR